MILVEPKSQATRVPLIPKTKTIDSSEKPLYQYCQDYQFL